MLANEGEHANVFVGIGLARLVGLHDEGPENVVAGTERDPEPVHGPGAKLCDLSLGNQPLEPVVRHVLRQAGPQDESCQAARVADPEWLPFIGVGHVLVHAVPEVGEADHLALAVVQRDVEVFAIREPADDLVDRRVEALEIACGVRRFGDSIQGRLDALLLLERRRCGLQFRDPRLGGRERLGTTAHAGTFRACFHVAPHRPPPRSVSSLAAYSMRPGSGSFECTT